MKSTKWKKAIIGILVVTLIVATTMLLTGFSSAKEYGGVQNKIECQEVMDLGLNSGTLRLVEERKDAIGNTIQIMRDDCYTYYYDTERKEVIVITINDSIMEKIVKDASDISMERIPLVDIDVMRYIKEIFPKYHLDTIKIDLDTESGSPIEFYRYTVHEYQDDIQTNRAQLSFSIDGQLTFVYGSHNEIDESKNYSRINEYDAIKIAYSYLVDKKDQYEKAMNANYSEHDSEKLITATEDMVLPDGVKVGETFELERLPVYEIFISSPDDMNISMNQKVVYGDTVAWLVEFTVKTSWGDVDPLFNPLFHVYVDAETGKVIELNTTDGE